MFYCFNIVTFLVSAIITILAGIFDCYAFSDWFCRVDSTCSADCAIIRQLVGTVIFIPVSIFPVIMYAVLFYKGRKARQSIRQTSASEAEKAKKEWRATITFFLMFLSLFLVSLPPGIVSLGATVAAVASNSTQSVWFFVLRVSTGNVFYLGHIADPIFIIRNKDVREVISEINWIPFLKVKTRNH